MFGEILKSLEPMVRPTLERLDSASEKIDGIAKDQEMIAERIFARLDEMESRIIQVIGESTEKILANLPK